jgi:hypothetical protein
MREMKEYMEKKYNSKPINSTQEFEDDWKSVGSLFEDKKEAAKGDIFRKKTPKKCQ